MLRTIGLLQLLVLALVLVLPLQLLLLLQALLLPLTPKQHQIQRCRGMIRTAGL